MSVDVKRVYEEPGPDDGTRVLVDRLWPRGLTKQDAQVDQWRKDVAPSSDLRRWFGHEPGRFEEFARRYVAELEGNPAVSEVAALGVDGSRLTLLYAARDTEHNHALVLRDVLRGYLDDTASGSGA
ncbi:DUF488 domain-containing protein [Isoptericola hypogeus]|uniref:DUF488 domain-containing protein n=1 Tax=Isoptericola hypogeus TaxID=300179 RepID=A0ABN2JTM3_9MICO